MVTFRGSAEDGVKDVELHTKWMPFDVVELRENSAAVDGRTDANELPNYSENDDRNP